VHLLLRDKASWVEPQIGPNDDCFDGYPELSIEDWHKKHGLWIEWRHHPSPKKQNGRSTRARDRAAVARTATRMCLGSPAEFSRQSRRIPSRKSASKG